MTKETIKNILLTEAGLPFKSFINRRLPNDVNFTVDSNNKVIFADTGDIIDRQDFDIETGEVFDPVIDELYDFIINYGVSIITTDYDNALAFREQHPDLDIKVIVRSGNVDIKKYTSNLYYMLSLKKTIDGFSFKFTQNLSDKAYENLAIKTIKESSTGKFVYIDEYNVGIMKSNYVKAKVFNFLLNKYVTVVVDDDDTYDYITTKTKKLYNNHYLINDEGNTFYLFNVKDQSILEKYDDYTELK